MRGFEKVWIEPGESKAFAVELLRRDLAFWDTEAQDWVVVEEATVFVGSSSRKLPLSQVVTL